MAKHLAGRLALSLISSSISVLIATYRVVDVKNPRLCRVADRRELHAPGSDRSCLHVELEIPETMMYVPCGGELLYIYAHARLTPSRNMCSYEAGDHIGIFAPNSTRLVEQAAKLLNVNLDSVVSVIPVAGGRPVIGPCTVRRVLAHFIELSSVPRKTFMIVRTISPLLPTNITNSDPCNVWCLSLSFVCYSYYRVFCNTLLIPMSEPSLNDYLLTMYVVAYIHSLTHHLRVPNSSRGADD